MLEDALGGYWILECYCLFGKKNLFFCRFCWTWTFDGLLESSWEDESFHCPSWGSRKWVLWAGKAVKVSEPERGECTFLRPSGAWIFSKLIFNAGIQYKNGGNIKLASGLRLSVDSWVSRSVQLGAKKTSLLMGGPLTPSQVIFY